MARKPSRWEMEIEQRLKEDLRMAEEDNNGERIPRQPMLQDVQHKILLDARARLRWFRALCRGTSSTET